MDKCPCQSGKEYDQCCGPIIAGETAAPSPEALMRARYSAHAKAAPKFLIDSLHESIRGNEKETDQEKYEQIQGDVSWDGLEIIESSEDGDKGYVDFIARYSIHNYPQSHREKAVFIKEDGRWYYLDGEVEGHVTYRRENPKVGRNDPCPCGSGKKFKKCCGA